MAKLTKTMQASLFRVLVNLERIQAFIASDRIAVCNIHAQATTTLHYTRAFVEGIDRPGDARPLTVMAKDIGSELCLLPDAIQSLKQMLTAG